ncbi:MAG: hypothetical protein KBS70_08255 [Bacteroidales bacterium]|nr:hypothetical protein [Candidatus Colicola equi]
MTTEYVAVTDTLRLRDTLFVALPIERKVYEDSTYRAIVSGYHASLDEIQVYQRTQTIYERVERTKKQRWTLGVSAGVGGFYGFTTRRFDVGTGVMVGVSYNF